MCKCDLCKAVGHLEVICRNKSSVNVTEVTLPDSFLSEVRDTDNLNKRWSTPHFVSLDDKDEGKHDFRLDVGADVSVSISFGWYSSQIK